VYRARPAITCEANAPRCPPAMWVCDQALAGALSRASLCAGPHACLHQLSPDHTSRFHAHTVDRATVNGRSSTLAASRRPRVGSSALRCSPASAPRCPPARIEAREGAYTHITWAHPHARWHAHGCVRTDVAPDATCARERKRGAFWRPAPCTIPCRTATKQVHHQMPTRRILPTYSRSMTRTTCPRCIHTPVA